MKTREEMFFEKVVMIPEHSCWEWVGAQKHDGYGSFWNGTKYQQSHRFAYERWVVEIGPGLCVLHKCDNVKCVNPAHLWLGTQTDNMRDMHAKGRGSRQSHHGPRGMTEDQVLSVLDELADGRSQRAVARKFGISQTFVWEIKAGRSWAGVRR